jgi:hypothetical protein
MKRYMKSAPGSRHRLVDASLALPHPLHPLRATRGSGSVKRGRFGLIGREPAQCKQVAQVEMEAPYPREADCSVNLNRVLDHGLRRGYGVVNGYARVGDITICPP